MTSKMQAYEKARDQYIGVSGYRRDILLSCCLAAPRPLLSSNKGNS